MFVAPIYKLATITKAPIFEMKYYLETNSLRKLNSSLEVLKENSFTSALSIFELISGIREQDFHIRKCVLENIFKSHIEIIWAFPEEITVNAFPGMEYEEERVNPLKKICGDLIESKNLKVFQKKASKGKFNLDFFKNLDKEYSNRFINATKNGNANLKKIIKDENEEYLIDFSTNFIKSLPENHSMNNSITLQAITDNLKKALELSSGELIDEKKIYEQYNGSINIFISAFSLFTARKNSEFNIPAKNDFIDLHHLIYLANNENYFIVTDDKMIPKMTNQVKKIDEIIEILKSNGC